MNISNQSNSISCSDAEWQARVDLAATFHILDHYGMSDLANGAVAARVPDQPDHYLIHPYGMFWEEATASAMVKIGPDGQPVNLDGPWCPSSYKMGHQSGLSFGGSGSFV
jgi:ribulose-5-phosphate 4-epimerase/fuculose-1-phosphate aldolase